MAGQLPLADYEWLSTEINEIHADSPLELCFRSFMVIFRKLAENFRPHFERTQAHKAALSRTRAQFEKVYFWDFSIWKNLAI